MSVVSWSGVTRQFGSFTAVDGVDGGIQPGEVLGLLGPNGAGKTTLIRMTLGLLAPSTGSITLFSEAPSERTRARLGYVAQGLGLYDDLSVRENLTFTAASYGGQVPDQLEPALEPFADRLVGELSLGVQRRAAFAAALSHAPDALILDEPTSGVDPLGRARLWDTIHEAADKGTSVLVSTHYMSEAQQCDRLLIMAEGRMVASGSVSDIVGDATVVEIRTDSWDAAFGALDDAGINVALAGRHLRAIDADEQQVWSVLHNAAVNSELATMPATLEERFVELVSEPG